MPPWKKSGLPSQKRPDAEEGRAKLKTTAMTTKSTEGHGRGMGVKDWLPKKDYQKSFPEEQVANDETEEQEGAKAAGRPAPTDMEKFFAKYGMKPPAWMEKIVLPEWLSRRISGRKKKKRKKKEDEVKDRTPKPLPVPKTIAGMLWIKFSERIARATGGLRARYQYHKRLRQMEGPGPVEQAAREFILEPSITFVKEFRSHGRALFEVDKGFNTKKQLEEREMAAENAGPEPTKVQSFITWHHLEDNQHRIQTILAILAVATILLGIVIEEIQFRGFIPGWSEDCANPEAPRDACYENHHGCFSRPDAAGAVVLECNPPDTDWTALNKIKVANSVMTVLMMYSLYILYRYEANIISLRNHIDFSDPRLLRYSFLQVGLLPWFCMELLLLMVHQLPYVSYDVIVNSSIFSGRPSVYSLDGILGLLMIGRLLQVLRWYRGYLFVKFQSRHFASRLNDEQMSTLLALRLFILKSPLLASSHFLLGCVAVGSYCYRVAESSTNPTASVYYWDSLWFVVDTLTGLPVADEVVEPKGQFGRTIAVVVRIMGILWYVLLVNSFKEWAKFAPDELQVQQWLRLSTRTNVVKVSQIRVIQYLFLYGKNHWATLRQLRRFQRAKIKLRLLEETGNQRENYDFDAFLRAITVRRTGDVKLFDERLNDVELRYRELDAMRLESTEASSRTGSMFGAVGARLSSMGAYASKGVRGATQAPQKLLYASTQAYKKVAASNFGIDNVSSDDDDDDMVLPGQVCHRERGEVTTSGIKFGIAEDEYDKETIRKARRDSLTIVAGAMNYQVILNAEEKENLRQRTIGSQLSDALKELRELRQTNHALLIMLGEKPEQVKLPTNLEEELKLEKWETDMCQRISEAEEQFANLNDSMTECMAQLMVLIGGLYEKRAKKKEAGTGQSSGQ